MRKVIRWRRGNETRLIEKDFAWLEKTAWHRVLTYVRNNEVIVRQTAHKELGFNVKQRQGSRLDNYRGILTRAGYLEKLSRGVYRRIKNIPDNLSYVQAIAEGRALSVAKEPKIIDQPSL